MAPKTTKFKAVILAGGSGERFWPLSTPEKPKQFLSIFGGKSLIRQAVERLSGLAKPEDIYIVTAKKYLAISRKELPEIPKANFIGEPMKRNTAAAVSLGVEACKEGIVGVFPADQLVAKPKAFQKSLKAAAKLASSKETIVTLGITPTYPATGFGYIDSKAGKFVEKPDLKHAKAYIKRGYLWNAGMFIAAVDTFRKAFHNLAPELEGVKLRDYEKLPSISFDYAIMEKYPAVSVVAADCGWDDVGSYAALEKYHPELLDENGNLIVRETDTPVRVKGIANSIIVVTRDGILVSAK